MFIHLNKINKYILKNKLCDYNVLSGDIDRLRSLQNIYLPWQKKLEDDWRTQLYSLDENKTTMKEAIEMYCGYLYGPINAYLRKQTSFYYGSDLSYVKKYIPLLDRTLEGQYAPMNLLAIKFLNRETLLYYFGQNYVQKGMIIKDNGYLSTALNWAHINTYEELNCHYGLFIIKIPRGTLGCYVDGISHRQDEAEFLLPRGTCFKIDKILNRSKNIFLCSIIDGLELSESFNHK